MKTTFIPQNILRVAAALLFTMIIAVGFTACTNEDNSVVTSSPEVVVGKWYYELNQHDTLVRARMPSNLTRLPSMAT